MKKDLKIIISGGGTGGHIFPAIAIANALRRIDAGIQILFVGAKGKMEMEKVPQAGYEIVGLTIAGFQRRLTIKNLLFPFKLIAGLLQAISVVRKFKPDVAVGVGGYASGPLLKVASWFSVPTVLQEQNSYPGVTNRLLASKASRICVAFDEMEKFFPAEKIVVTGNPIRQNIVEHQVTRQEAASHFGLDPEKPIVFITGGSLGAKAINEGIAAGFDMLIREGVQLIWQTGRIYLDQYQALEEKAKNQVRILDFIAKMEYAYSAADIIVSRAGGTISELCIIGKPSILLPSPNVAEDHQTKNVEALVKNNAAVLIKDTEATQRLANEIIALISDKERRAQLSQNIHQMAKPDAADRIAREVLSVAG